jgi:hypothetical protein
MKISHWFQNFKSEGQHLFHFRGSVRIGEKCKTLFRYEVSSGPNLAVKYTHGDEDSEGCLYLGLIFFSIWVHFPLPRSWLFQRKCVATWDNNREFWLIDEREYGFYVYQWAIVWCWHKKADESGGNQPWWRGFYFRIDDFFLGKTEYMTRDIATEENVVFKLGGKEFVMNSIHWVDATWFRRRIPLALHSQKMVRVEMKIEKPPMRSGKGENSWDCGDDGSFGVVTVWKHERPTWRNSKEMARLAVADYVAGVLKDAKRYGGSSSERGINATDQFEYVGRKQTA